jgi:hypothetical protein
MGVLGKRCQPKQITAVVLAAVSLARFNCPTPAMSLVLMQNEPEGGPVSNTE